jgi:hypothetical protein
MITVVHHNYEELSVLKEDKKNIRFWYPGMLRRALGPIVPARA